MSSNIRRVANSLSRRIRTPSLLSLRGYVASTLPLFEKQTMKVPTMGDSITEGTIVEWVAQVGQAVSEDDVIAMIETDKVTIEIKATTGGVVTQHFGQIDETVEVGSALYELDTEGTATITAPTVAASASTSTSSQVVEATTAIPEAMAVTDSTVTSHRSPSIRFLGKDGWAKAKSLASEIPSHKATTISSSSSSVTTNASKTKTVVVHDDSIHPMYGRPIFSEEEIEALLMGGASIAPQVIRYSTNAKFKV